MLFRKVKIYTNSIEIISALRDYPACIMELAAICREIQVPTNDFDYCMIEKCNRDKVKEAHDLAGKARNLG